MTAAVRNLVIEQGATYEQGLVYNDSAGEPVDLTDHTARMHIREAYDSEDALIELTTENGRITLGGTAGTIVLYISDEDTEALDFSSARYDLELVQPDGRVKRLLRGKVKLMLEATK
jgi:hypothetical protein